MDNQSSNNSQKVVMAQQCLYETAKTCGTKVLDLIKDDEISDQNVDEYVKLLESLTDQLQCLLDDDVL